MHKLLIPFFMALSALPMTVSLEGTLLVNYKALVRLHGFVRSKQLNKAFDFSNLDRR